MTKTETLCVRIAVRWWVESYIVCLGALASLGFTVNVDKAAERIARLGVRYFTDAE
jgi:hypothetical protein